MNVIYIHPFFKTLVSFWILAGLYGDLLGSVFRFDRTVDGRILEDMDSDTTLQGKMVAP